MMMRPHATRWTITKATAFGLSAGMATAAFVGIPTDVIPTPWFTRMTPVRPQDYVVLILTALLAAALGASYAVPTACPVRPGRLAAGGYLSVLAVGCPICNKLVVLLLGIGGALTIFQPLQPVFAFASLALLGYALVLRLRAIRTLPGGPTTAAVTESR